MTTRPNNLGLDVVRAFAIIAVLFSHTADWFLGAGRSTDIHAAYVGGTGVEIFFSLSGFLIGGILLRTLDRGLTPPAIGQFWIRRWLRTLPAYWVLIAAMCWWFGFADWRSPIFLQNFVPKTQWAPLTPQTWSLVLEEWFYLFVPPLILLASLALPKRWVVPAVCALLFAVCTTLRTQAYAHPDPALWGDDLSVNPFLRLDCAAWGVLAAWAPRPNRVWSWVLFILGCALLVGFGIVFELSYTPERLLPYGYIHWVLVWEVLHTSLIELSAMFVLLGLAILLPTGHGPAAWFARTTARLSYALYLVHVPVIYLGRLYGLDDHTGWPARIAVVIIIIAVAITMRGLVERPVLAARDWLLPERPKQQIGAATAAP
jgi:peptidoglycan/LPS O-acetylase OafA/YrhL